MSAPWFSVATHFKGTTEVHGSVDNPKILEMYRLSGHPEIEHDETPWCAAFVGACLSLSGYRGTQSLLARDYQKFGQDLKQQPQRGCIVVLWRGDPNASTGHVAFYDRDDGDHVVLLGGNQGDAVTTRSFPKSQVLGYRWPTQTAPLPANTPLPNILTIDPSSAPPHLLNGSGGAAIPLDVRREPRATEALTFGAEGPEVSALQSALSTRNFQVGPIDGEFGPLTQAAVASFQTAQGLPISGSADPATLRALGLAPSPPPLVIPPRPFDLRLPGLNIGGGRMTIQPQNIQPQAMPPQDILKLLFDALITKQGATSPAPATPATGGVNTAQLLQTVLGALAAKQPPLGQLAAPATLPTLDTAPPALSPIDSWLGGQALAGKKTALAVLAYTVLSVLQAVGVAGTATGATATTTGQILTTLIAAFGGLGGLAKIDRVVQMLGIVAAKPPAAVKLD